VEHKANRHKLRAPSLQRGTNRQTDRLTNQATNQPTNRVAYRVVCTRLKNSLTMFWLMGTQALTILASWHPKWRILLLISKKHTIRTDIINQQTNQLTDQST